MSKLCGKQFWLAFCEAKDVTRAIKKNGGEDFNK
ncbi:putative inner membrane protein, partial [Salmonella enterica subsp. enterica serovar Minnesota str. A4-603]